jgi:hypothetical protein
MKTFLYCITSLRDGSEDGQTVWGGTHYHHDQLLVVIDAVDVEHAAGALNTKVIGSFVRSSVKCPTIYYTSDYYGGKQHPDDHPEGYFFLFLKELESSDKIMFPNLEEKIHFKVVAPQIE